MAARSEGIAESPEADTRPTAGSWRHTRRARRRLGWGVADQAVSSLTNFAVNIYIIRRLGVAQYGAFALAYVTYGFVLQASRGLATDPLLVRFSNTDLPSWRHAVSSSTGTATVTGVVGGVLALVTAAFLDGPTRMAFLALGITLPVLMLQDSWRFAFFALGRGSQALLNDTVWAVGLVIALIYLRYAGLANVFWYVFAWGAAAGAGAAFGVLQTRVIPRVSRARDWLSRQRDLGTRYLVEGTSYGVAGQLRIYGIGLILGLVAVGYIQAASTLMGPFQVVLFGMGLAALPEAVRILHRSPRHLMIFCVICSVGLMLVALAWGITLMIVLPRGLGEWLLGPVWRPAYTLILPTTLFMMAGCVSAGASTYMHALGAARRSLSAALFTSIAFFIGSLLGALAAGAVGAVLGAAAATFLGSLVYWWQLRTALRETRGIPIAERTRPTDEEASDPMWIPATLNVQPSDHQSLEGPQRHQPVQRSRIVRRRLLRNAQFLLMPSPARPSSALSPPSKPRKQNP